MLSVREALDLVLKNTQTKSARLVPLQEASGLSLAEDVIAAVDLPQFDNSAMDGFALRASDLVGAGSDSPVRLRIRGAIAAGSPFEGTVGAGQCVQIMTGAPVPEGADAVVMKEDVDVEGEDAVFQQPTVCGENIRFRGEDIRRCEKVLSRGDLIGPAQVALLAAQGYAQLRVIPRAQVGIVATGDELVRPGGTLGPGKIYDSNSFMLRALVQEAGACVKSLGVAKDNREEIACKIREALKRDVAIIAGGVSVGIFDCVKDMLCDLGVDEVFWKVRIKPGMPLFFGKKADTLVFGVPGNPVSAFVIFEEFIRPAIRRLMGREPTQRSAVQAVLKEGISKKPGRTTYVRAICSSEDGRLSVVPAGAQGSHHLKSLVRANALLILPEEAGRLQAGTNVVVKLLG